MNYDLLIDLHKDGKRQGPGDDTHTQLALNFSGLLQRSELLKLADIGCGTGASTLVLAENLNAAITAVDLFPQFLNILQRKAKHKKLKGKIEALPCSMDSLPFQENSLDAIWTEGAIYNMGFKKGVAYFKRFLKPKGILSISEITWLTQNRPEDLTSYWHSEYPEIAIGSEKIKILEQQGFTLKAYFPLPESCWFDSYYHPLQNRFKDFLAKHTSEEAQSIVNSEIHEIEQYKKYRDYYSYAFYIAEKI
ncbi:MAG: class I SAM-dependent methyltransferase [Pseudomonadota bacterium]